MTEPNRSVYYLRPVCRVTPDTARQAAFVLFATLLASAFFETSTVSAEQVVYTKKETWAETVLACRDSYARWWRRQLGPVQVGLWHTTEGKGEHILDKPVKLTALDKLQAEQVEELL